MLFFIDDFIRKCWIFLILNKDEVFSKFVEFKALVKKDIGKKEKALMSDNEGEFVSHAFKYFCSKEGI